MKMKNENEVAQSCPTLRDPMDCSPPGSSVHEIFQARVLEWGAIAFSSTGSKKDAKEMKTSSKLSPIQLMILSITIDELCKLGQVITTLNHSFLICKIELMFVSTPQCGGKD